MFHFMLRFKTSKTSWGSNNPSCYQHHDKGCAQCHRERNVQIKPTKEVLFNLMLFISACLQITLCRNLSWSVFLLVRLFSTIHYVSRALEVGWETSGMLSALKRFKWASCEMEEETTFVRSSGLHGLKSREKGFKGGGGGWTATGVRPGSLWETLEVIKVEWDLVWKAWLLYR